MTPTPTTRASLLFRLRDSQDHEAWVEFVEIDEPIIYRQLRKCGLQDADARELMQEFFIAVSRRIEHWVAARTSSASAESYTRWRQVCRPSEPIQDSTNTTLRRIVDDKQAAIASPATELPPLVKLHR